MTTASIVYFIFLIVVSLLLSAFAAAKTGYGAKTAATPILRGIKKLLTSKKKATESRSANRMPRWAIATTSLVLVSGLCFAIALLNTQNEEKHTSPKGAKVDDGKADPMGLPRPEPMEPERRPDEMAPDHGMDVILFNPPVPDASVPAPSMAIKPVPEATSRIVLVRSSKLLPVRKPRCKKGEVLYLEQRNKLVCISITDAKFQTAFSNITGTHQDL